MSSLVDGIPLPVLTGENYEQWQLRIKTILEAKGLDEIVDTGRILVSRIPKVRLRKMFS